MGGFLRFPCWTQTDCGRSYCCAGDAGEEGGGEDRGEGRIPGPGMGRLCGGARTLQGCRRWWGRVTLRMAAQPQGHQAARRACGGML